MTLIPTNALKAALRTRLTAATALTALLSGTTAVYYGVAPTGTALPYVVVTIATDRDAHVTPTRELLYTVDIKAIDDDGPTAGTIAAQIDEAMKTDVDVASWGTVDQWRERGIDYEELDAGKRYYHQGGTWQIRLEQV